MLDDVTHELWLSPISAWELVMLVERRRLVLDQPVESWVAEALRRVPLTEAPLTYEIAIESRQVRLAHRDPADRLIAATARVLGLTLVTADERLIDSRAVPTLANR